MISYKRLAYSISIFLALSILSPEIISVILKYCGFTAEPYEGIIFSLAGGVIPLIILVGSATYLRVGLLLSGVMLSIYILLSPASIKFEKLNRQLSDVVSILSSYVRAGMPIVEALKKTASFVGPPISEHLEAYVYLITTGENPLKAEALVTKNLPREARLVFSSISQAIRSGGRYVEAFSYSERYLRHFTRLSELRKNKLAEYKVILVLSVIAYAFSGVVTLMLVGSISGSISRLPLVAGLIDVEMLRSAYYISALILTAVTSVIMNKTIEGYAIKSLKYTSLLTLVVTAIFTGSQLI